MPTPTPGADEVLVRVGAAGVNNTDINMRTGRLLGCTIAEPEVFAALVRYIERAQIAPVLAKTYQLRDIVDAQRDFLTKRHLGKIVLTPSRDGA
jgi:NADPH:quinone reductase-like Zn-dependent oxidoreductase